MIISVDTGGAFFYALPPHETLSSLRTHRVAGRFAGDGALRPMIVGLRLCKGVLLLNNGEVIAGTITPAGDRYDVSLDDAEIHVKKTEVATLCASLDECYQFKRAGNDSGGATGHLMLAEWCIKNGLLEAAEREIGAMRAEDAGHPKIRLLEPRLELAKSKPRTPDPINTGEKNASAEQLDTLARNLPAGAMESFTLTIQPVLLNNCAVGLSRSAFDERVAAGTHCAEQAVGPSHDAAQSAIGHGAGRSRAADRE